MYNKEMKMEKDKKRSAVTSFAKLSLTVIPWLALIAIGVLYLYQNVSFFPWKWQEKGRVLSPLCNCELVTYEGNRGAMSSYAYVCFLLRRGDKADPNNCDYYEPILSSSHSLPTANWKNDHTLIINTGDGKVSHLRPYSQEFDVVISLESEKVPLKSFEK